MSSYTLLSSAVSTHSIFHTSKTLNIPKITSNGYYYPLEYPLKSPFSSPFFNFTSWPGLLNPKTREWSLTSPFCRYFEDLMYVPDSFDIFIDRSVVLSESYPSDDIRAKQKLSWGLSHNSLIDDQGHLINLIQSSRLISEYSSENSIHFVYICHSEGLNYFHWLTEYLPRVYLLHLAFGPFISSNIIFASIGCTPRSFHADSINIFNSEISARYIHYPSTTRIPRSIVVQTPSPGWCATFYLRDMVAFIKANMPYHENILCKFANQIIFVVRGQDTKNNRDLSAKSLEQFLSFCQDSNIIVLDPSDYSFTEQVAIFSSVRAVVGVHGAAFANQIFCNINTRVLEFVPRSSSAIPTCYLSSVSQCHWSCFPLEYDVNGMLELKSYYHHHILNWLLN